MKNKFKLWNRLSSGSYFKPSVKGVSIPKKLGQKLFGICVLIGGTVLIFSGWILWAFPHLVLRETVALLGLLHTFFACVLTLFLLVHLFLGIYMLDDFKSMILHGKIPYNEAKEMSPVWVEKEIISIFKN